MLAWLPCWVSSIESTSMLLRAESSSRAGPSWSGVPGTTHFRAVQELARIDVVGVVVHHAVDQHHGVGPQRVHQDPGPPRTDGISPAAPVRPHGTDRSRIVKYSGPVID